MVNWFVVLVVIAFIFLFFKIAHLKHSKRKFFLVILLIVLTFFLVSLYLVAKSNNVDMTTLNGFSNGIQLYAGWLINGFQNFKSIVGYAVGMDWSAKNKSVSLEEIKGVIGSNKENEVKENVSKEKKANVPKLITVYR